MFFFNYNLNVNKIFDIFVNSILKYTYIYLREKKKIKIAVA